MHTILKISFPCEILKVYDNMERDLNLLSSPHVTNILPWHNTRFYSSFIKIG